MPIDSVLLWQASISVGISNSKFEALRLQEVCQVPWFVCVDEDEVKGLVRWHLRQRVGSGALDDLHLVR